MPHNRGMAVDLSAEMPKISQVCALRNVDPFLIAAIRVAENGPPAKNGGKFGEFGCPTSMAPDYDSQLRVCSRTIAGYLQEYDANPFVLVEGPQLKRLRYSAAFLSYCQIRYAPTDPVGDPQNLNANWLVNVTAVYQQAVEFGFPMAPL